MIFKYCAECGHKLEDIKCGDDDCKICPSCKKIFGSSPFPVGAVLVVNEYNEILLLKQNYISEAKWTVVSGYMIDGETIEDAVVREVKEETGQDVISCKYISSYYFEPKQLIMIGFIAYVKKSQFSDSDEVDDIKWYKIDEVNDVIARENNCSGMHFDKCREFLMQLNLKNKDMEIMVDYENREVITLEKLLPDWWGMYRYKKDNSN